HIDDTSASLQRRRCGIHRTRDVRQSGFYCFRYQRILFIKTLNIKRGCDYQDVLNMLLFYASPKASYCTGQSINVTGGQVMF
ncbi:hypothetical protein MJM45_29480, partial [Salmonella enterica subsp. enterica serovar Kentucky]|nr:hypothetical protein [Salmonella enterica subsp. enterica serovar Kentucky]